MENLNNQRKLYLFWMKQFVDPDRSKADFFMGRWILQKAQRGSIRCDGA